jgi:hypothetical protein
MSRIPQPSSSRTSKPPSTPVRSKVSSGSTPIRSRTQPGARAVTPAKSKAPEVPQTPSVPLSIKEVIALKRAEVKKGQSKAGNGSLDSCASPEDTLPNAPSQQEDDILGRLSVRETIEKARNTGENQPITLCRAELNKGS